MSSIKKKKSVLLVDPAYKSYYPPLGLMKISSWLKKKGHSVDFVKDGDVNNFYGYRQDDVSTGKQKIVSAKDVVDIVMPQLRDLKTEVFKVM